MFTDPSGEALFLLPLLWTTVSTSSIYATLWATLNLVWWAYLITQWDEILENFMYSKSWNQSYSSSNSSYQAWAPMPWGNSKKPKKDRWKQRNKHTNQDYHKEALKKGWKPTNYLSKNRPVYKWPWRNNYFSPEKTAHNIDFWWKQWIMRWGKFIYQKTVDNIGNIIKIK